MAIGVISSTAICPAAVSACNATCLAVSNHCRAPSRCRGGCSPVMRRFAKYPANGANSESLQVRPYLLPARARHQETHCVVIITFQWKMRVAESPARECQYRSHNAHLSPVLAWPNVAQHSPQVVYCGAVYGREQYAHSYCAGRPIYREIQWRNASGQNAQDQTSRPEHQCAGMAY